VHGQDQTARADVTEPIATDRPAVTNSSVVVPAGSLQAENGLLETSSQGQSIVDGPETVVRFGVATKTELRLTMPAYYYNLNAVWTFAWRILLRHRVASGASSAEIYRNLPRGCWASVERPGHCDYV
jgi:hypothetical protein